MRRRPPSELAAVFGLALAARLLYWWLVTPDWVPRADADQYLVLARSLAHGDGFAMVFPQLDLHATAFRPPLYPFVLTPGAWLFGDAIWPARLLTAALGSTAVVLAAVLARRLAGQRSEPAGRLAFWVTGALMAVYPPLLANDTVTLTEPLAMVLLLVALLALDDRRWVLCGVTCGLLVLARPNGYLVVPVVALFLVQSVGWRRAAASAGIAVLCVAPWVVRNQIQVGTTRLVTSDGFTMAAIYSAEAQARESFVDPVFDPAFDDPAYRWAQFDEAAWSAVLSDAAVEGVRDNPAYVVRTLRSNAGAYFELRPSANRWAEDNDGRNWDFRSATLPGFYLVTLAGVVGVGWSIRDRGVWPLAVIVAQFVVLSLVLVAPPRLRTPFDVMCCIGVGLLAARLAERRGLYHRRP